MNEQTNALTTKRKIIKSKVVSKVKSVGDNVGGVRITQSGRDLGQMCTM